MNKLCSGCGETKDLVEYHRARAKRDGRRSKCKACTKASTHSYHAANRERLNARSREYRKAHLKEYAAHMRRYREQDPQRFRDTQKRSRERNSERVRQMTARRDPVKIRAKASVRQAVRHGILVPLPRCGWCGHDFSVSRREAHHHDYTKPLDVEWLCARCHRRHHNGKYVGAPHTDMGDAAERKVAVAEMGSR